MKYAKHFSYRSCRSRKFSAGIRAIPLYVALFMCILLTGCQHGTSPEGKKAPAPFSELTWESTYDDMVALEGAAEEGRPSVYGGLAYDYSKSYGDREGTVTYMYNEEDQLVSIAWSYNASSPEELDAAYQKLYGQIAEQNGESEKAAGYNNYGDIWRREEGNIILSAVATDEMSMLLYSHLSPQVSTLEVGKE